MMENIIKNINYYKTRSSENLLNEQISYIPHLEEDQIECTINSYMMDGKRHIINQYEYLCIRLKYLKFNNRIIPRVDSEGNLLYRNSDGLLTTVQTYTDSNGNAVINNPSVWNIREMYTNINTPMIDLVNNKVIKPFALFIEGRFIPWDIISISISNEIPYLLIRLCDIEKITLGETFSEESQLPVSTAIGNYAKLSNGDYYRFNGAKWVKDNNLHNNTNYSDLIKPEYVQILALPDYISYSNIGKDLTNYDVLYSFNDEGLFDVENPSYSLIIDKDNPHVCTTYLHPSSNILVYDISKSLIDKYGNSITLDKIRMHKENVFLFTNGKLDISNIKPMKYGTDWDYLEDSDEFDPKIQLEQNSKEYSNTDIRFDHMNLTINLGENNNNDTYDIVVCVNTEYSNSIDHVVNLDNTEVREEIDSWISNYNGTFDDSANNKTLKTIKSVFKLNMDKNKPYSENIIDAIKTMLAYNNNSFSKTFELSSNLEITEYTGLWVNKNKRVDNTLWIPRRHDEMHEEFIIMLVNGELYKYGHAVNHRANFCIIPITGINDDDIIEFLRFKNVNNNILDITINESDDFANYSSDVINNDMMLFSSEHDPDDPYTYPIDGKQYFPVNYSIERNESNGYLKIILENSFYYGKPLKIAYRNRYVHAQYAIPSDDYVQYVIDLGDKFKYCTDYNRFMVFYDGRKLDSSLYRIVIPSRTTTPYYDFKLYFSIPVEEYKKIDIIYAPSLMQDIVYEKTIKTTGLINIEHSILNYGLDTNLFMIWINGRKIPASHIENMNSYNMRIIVDEKSINNLTITKYIPDIDIISQYYGSLSQWDEFNNDIPSEKILTDVEPDIYAGSVDIKTIMYELIREQYMMNPRVDVTDKFSYGYNDVDETVITEYDNTNTAIIEAADANKTDNLNGTVWSEDVPEELDNSTTESDDTTVEEE